MNQKPEHAGVVAKIHENIHDIQRKPRTHENSDNADEEVNCFAFIVTPSINFSFFLLLSNIIILLNSLQSDVPPAPVLSVPAPEWEGSELPVDPDMGKQEDTRGEEELDTEDKDTVV